jgi:chloramphenicol O-acetyltransferase
MLVALCVTFILPLFVLHQHHRARSLAEIKERVSRIEEQMSTFFDNAHERSSILDQETEDARVAFREAQVTFNRMHKAFLRMRRAFDNIHTSQQPSKK